MPGALERAWMLEAKLAAPSAVDSGPWEEKIAFSGGAGCSPHQREKNPKEIVWTLIREKSLNTSNIIRMHKISHIGNGLRTEILS